jgi:hypothetical protein
MKRCVALTAALLVLSPLVGCDSLTNLLNPTQVTVRLVNNTDFTVTVQLRLSGDQNVLESLLTTLGEESSVTLTAGQSSTIVRSCDDLQAIMVERADVNYIIGIGPNQQSDVYRDGTDFDCGDTIVFTFTQPNLLALNIDFNRGVAVP